MATSNFSGRSYSSAPDLYADAAPLPPPRSHPPLPDDGTLELWEKLEKDLVRWEDFSLTEKDIIVQHYAPSIRFIALRMKAKLPRNIEVSELISAGTVGLLEALAKFQANRGIKFESYAESRIRGAMLDELRRLDWFPRSLRQRVRKIEDAIWQLEHENKRSPSVEEIQERTELPMRDVHQGLEALQSQLCIPLDAIQDSLAGEEDAPGSPFQDTMYSELVTRIASLVDTLTQREKLVLSLYYTDELNMQETAQVLGISEGRVSQLHSQAIARLRRGFYEQGEGKK